jgi:hypothetical protein
MSWSIVKRVLTLCCDESTRLVSESLDRELPFGERLAVRLHALCCRSCRRCRKQFVFLRQALVRRMHDAEMAVPSRPALSGEARARIKRVLANEAAEDSP